MAFESQALEVVALTVTIGLAGYTAIRLNRPRARVGDRAREIVRQTGGAVSAVKSADIPTPGQQMSQAIAALGARLPLFNHKQRQQITHMLLSAGIRHPRGLSLFIATKLLSGGIGAFAGSFILRMLPLEGGLLAAAFALLGGLQVGLMLPELALHSVVKQRQRSIHRSLPDALDLLVICTNAGYSLAASIRRISAEMRELCPPLANELDITAHDIQLSAETTTALRNLAERCKVESLRSLVATLIQAQEYGTPITQSLKTLAKTERSTRILLLEEKGAKLAAKLTLPMMLLILPAVVLLAGAPAMMQLSEALK